MTPGPVRELTTAVASIAAPIIRERVDDLRKAALESNDAKTVHVAKHALGVMRASLRTTLDLLDHAANEVTTHWAKCLEREANGRHEGGST
jgi:hypothetical protein